MIDLSNPDKLTLKDMPDDMAAAMFHAWRGGAYMEANFERLADGWRETYANSTITPWSVIRVRPEPATMPVYPWHLFPPEYQWGHVDANDCAYLTTNGPERGVDGWHGGEKVHRCDGLIGYSRGTCDWKLTKQRRPEGV